MSDHDCKDCKDCKCGKPVYQDIKIKSTVNPYESNAANATPNQNPLKSLVKGAVEEFILWLVDNNHLIPQDLIDQFFEELD